MKRRGPYLTKAKKAEAEEFHAAHLEFDILPDLNEMRRHAMFAQARIADSLTREQRRRMGDAVFELTLIKAEISKEIERVAKEHPYYAKLRKTCMAKAHREALEENEAMKKEG